MFRRRLASMDMNVSDTLPGVRDCVRRVMIKDLDLDIPSQPVITLVDLLAPTSIAILPDTSLFYPKLESKSMS